MYSICGKIIYKNINSLVIKISNLSFEIFSSNIESFIINDEVELFTKVIIKDENICIFGFKTLFEMTLFKNLITVNGVGPKIALNSMNGIDPQIYASAIANNNIDLLASLKSINGTIAHYIVNKLNKKYTKISVFDSFDNEDFKELFYILKALGFKESEIDKVKPKISKDKTRKDNLNLCLKLLKNEN